MVTLPEETLSLVSNYNFFTFVLKDAKTKYFDLGISGEMGDNGYNQTTLTYSTGPGFMEHINNRSTNPFFPWYDSTVLNIHDKEFRQVSINPMGASAHGGEDVAVYATGNSFKHIDYLF